MKNVRKTHEHAGTRVRNVMKANGNLNNTARFNNDAINTNMWNAVKADLEAAYTIEKLS